MNIKNFEDCPRFNKRLDQADPGQPIEFESVPHQKHADGSTFIVLRVPTEYIAKRHEDGTYRIMVANLATGSVSLVLGSRVIRFVDAEVQKL